MTSKLKLVFAGLMTCALLLGAAASLTGGPCEECSFGPSQTLSDLHGEPDCAWAQMHACTKVRWAIADTCPDGWLETSVSQSPCVQQPNGNFRSTCTITFKCEFCIDKPCEPWVP